MNAPVTNIEPAKRTVGSLDLPPVEALASITLGVGDDAPTNLIGLLSNDIRSRPFSLLRGQVLKEAGRQDIRLIGVTSAAPGAGKTFVSSNLAAAIGRISGRQVYLLDLDLRRPSIAERFGVVVETGMESYFDGSVDDLSTIGRRIEGTGLALFGTRRMDPYPGELLGGARLENLIAAMRRLPPSALVICDLPPAFVGDDALTVISKLDAYIHVVDEGTTPKRQAEELRSMMQPATCLGVVLNRYDGRWNDSYGYASARQYARYYDTAE
ncbi:MAG: CpsD/CapB family tyrosine-protein kinase [Sphingomonadales bacterium]